MEPAAIGHSLVDMWARLDGEGFEGEHAPGPAFEEALRYFDGHFDELKERTGIVRQRASLTFNSGSGLLEVRYPQIFSGNTKRAKEANSNVLGNLGQLKLSWAFKQMCGKPENFGGYLKVLFGEESLENLLSYTEANTRGFDRTEFLRLD